MPPELTPEIIAEKRKNLILNAIGILEDEGIDALTLRHLAVVSDVSRSTPYLYFKDKAALTDAIRIHSLHDLSARCKQAITGTGMHVEQMRLLGDTLISFGLRHPELYQLIFVVGLTGREKSKEFCKAIDQYKKIIEAPMLAAYVDGMISLPPERLNPVLWAAIHGMLMLNNAGLTGDDASFVQLRSDIEQVLAMGFVVTKP